MDLSACCQSAPYCTHNHRQLQSQELPSLDATLNGELASWSSRFPLHQQSQYGFSRIQPPALYPSQTLNFLSDQDKVRAASIPYSTSSNAPSWASSTYSGLGNDFVNTTWLPSRIRDIPQPSGSSPFSHENNNYVSNIKYESLDPRDISPSPATEFSNVSASSQASPVPAPNYIGYGGLRAASDESPYMTSQALSPEHLRAHDEARRMSLASFDPESPSRHSRTRSRKGSDAIRCHVCLKSFDRRSNFKSHWETHDKDRQRTACKVDGCTKTFGRPAEMTRHVNSAHRQKSYPCMSCGKEFTRHDILLRHCKDACPILVKGKGSGRKRRSKDS